MDMYKTVQQARAITRRRLSRIRKRAKGGQTLPMPYFLACLAQAVDTRLRPHATPTASPGREMRNEAPLEATPEPPAPSREAFWLQMAELTNIGSLREYCHTVGRPPRYDDLRYSIALMRERQRR